METSGRSQILWWQSLRFQGVLVLGCAVGWLVLGIVSVMETQGKALIVKESERFVEQTGNQATAHLSARLDEIAAVTRTLATTSQQLPKSEEVFKQTIPTLLDFNGDLEIAGGGIWPEPSAFELGRARRSFFWGRNAQGKMTYYDDYNQSGAGYHNESWYVVARHLQPGTCSWSESYVDPYSLEPMVTCSVATVKDRRFTGVATIDLKMGGLADWIRRWQKDVGGYTFIVDRNNRFIAFPATDKVRKVSQDSQGKATEEALLASQLASQESSFLPIADALTKVNQHLLEKAQGQADYDPGIAATLHKDSYQIDPKQAQLIAAVLKDPLGSDSVKSQLITQLQINNDFLLRQPATVFVFHVPGAYWKLVIVKPTVEIAGAANRIIWLLIAYALFSVLVAAPFAYGLLRQVLLNPLARMTYRVRDMEHAIAEQNWEELSQIQIQSPVKNEIGHLGQAFNALSQKTCEQGQQLQSINQELQRSFAQLQTTQGRLIQQEKMSSLGQLVAGVAHEINNPVSFIQGNLSHLNEYALNLLDLIQLYQNHYPMPPEDIAAAAENMDLGFLQTDMPKLLSSMNMGTERICQIVLSLRNFSRMDEADFKVVDIHEGMDSTLMILHHRLKATPDRPAIQVVKHYGDLPRVECYPSQLNQVFMNILANAIDALDQAPTKPAGPASERPLRQITIQTSVIDQQWVRIGIADNGAGISDEIQHRIFDPFFTTKPLGKGTGMGMSISYQIIVEKHGGELHCVSVPDQKTEFSIRLPIQQSPLKAV